MTLINDAEVTLYPHQPKTLLPLLENHLPYAASLYGTIKTNRWPRGTTSSDVSLPHARTKLDQEAITSVVWATFPASKLDTPPEIWGAVIHLPSPQRRQTRSYCSVERALVPKGKDMIEEEKHKVWRKGQDLVNGMVRTIIHCSPVIEVLGSVSTLWAEEIWQYVRTDKRPVYDSWLAPLSASSTSAVKPIQKDGLVVDQARIEDCPMIQQTRDIPEILEYYTSRLDKITVIRSVPTSPPARHDLGSHERGEAVAWIMTHSAGDLGALYTQPEYRRRGLAKWVVEERLKGMREDGMRAMVWVGQDNEQSQALWKSLGWERGWSAQWIPVR